MIQLTDADLDAARRGQPVRLTDPSCEGEFVLVTAQVFERMRAEHPADASRNGTNGDPRNVERYLTREFADELLAHCRTAVRSVLPNQ